MRIFILRAQGRERSGDGHRKTQHPKGRRNKLLVCFVENVLKKVNPVIPMCARRLEGTENLYSQALLGFLKRRGWTNPAYKYFHTSSSFVRAPRSCGGLRVTSSSNYYLFHCCDTCDFHVGNPTSCRNRKRQHTSSDCICFQEGQHVPRISSRHGYKELHRPFCRQCHRGRRQPFSHT